MIASILRHTFALVSVAGVALSLGGCAIDPEDATSGEDETVDATSSSEDALTAGCSHCTVVPQKSIRGITIGMKQSDVRALLGSPSKIERLKNEIAGPYTVYTYGLTYVTFFSYGAGDILTRSPKVKTASGIGIGSTEADVEAKVAHVKCSSYKGSRSCTVGKQVPGETTTTFQMANGKVQSILLGSIID